jgi:hypothetical protein
MIPRAPERDVYGTDELAGPLPIGTTGTTTRDSRPRSWNTVLSATTRRRSRPIASPVLGLTSNRGKFELDTSSRIRCPGMNRLLVG